MRSQAKKLQDALAQETSHISHNGIDLIINGNQEITAITVSEELLSADKKEKLETAIKDAVNQGVKKVQGVMAKKMQDMQKSGDFTMPQF